MLFGFSILLDKTSLCLQEEQTTTCKQLCQNSKDRNLSFTRIYNSTICECDGLLYVMNKVGFRLNKNKSPRVEKEEGHHGDHIDHPLHHDR